VTGPRPRLSRTAPAPPVRIVHLGLGAFSRSHVAWYTHRAADAEEWGIAAYTGASAELAERLTGQGGLYTLVERGAAHDTFETVTSIVRAQPGGDLESWLTDLSATTTAIVTLTITEAGYRLTPLDTPDLSDPRVVRDIDLLGRLARDGTPPDQCVVATALGRLVLGLEVRRRAGAGPLSIVSCDNLPDNGGHLGRGLVAFADACLPQTAAWIRENVAFVGGSVDRITPRVDDLEMRRLRTRLGDAAPVVCEPFSDWVMSGDFPAGRPRWEDAGVRFVDDIEPWEARKLWLLNGSHSILAWRGILAGHETVADAIADRACRDLVETFWDEAERNLPGELDIPAYRRALLDRYENPRIEHRLDQIAADSSVKARLRIVPVAVRELAQERPASGCAQALAAFLAASDAKLLPVDRGRPSRPRLEDLSPELAASAEFADAVREWAAILSVETAG
jgi:fructuronate reductase